MSNTSQKRSELRLLRGAQASKGRTRHETEGGDDQVARRDLEKPVPRRPTRAVETNLLQHDVLVQVDPVEPVRGRVSISG